MKRYKLPEGPNTLTLTKGSHRTREEGMCAMEAVAWLAGEPHTDAPACVCPTIRRIMVIINDRIIDDADRTTLLTPYLTRVIGTAGNVDTTRRRAFICADYAVRRFAPNALRQAGREDEAATLESLRPVADQKTAYAAAAAAYAAAYDTTLLIELLGALMEVAP